MIPAECIGCGVLLASGRARCARCALADPALEVRRARDQRRQLGAATVLAVLALVAAGAALYRSSDRAPPRATVTSSPPCWRLTHEPEPMELQIMARTTSRKDNPDDGRRKVREFTDDLERVLTAEGRTAEAMQLAELLHEYEQIEETKKRENKKWTERMKKIREAMTKHTRHARTGKRTDSVTIEEFFEIATGEVFQVATDTGEVLKTRRATMAEADEYAEFGAH